MSRGRVRSSKMRGGGGEAASSSGSTGIIDIDGVEAAVSDLRALIEDGKKQLLVAHARVRAAGKEEEEWGERSDTLLALANTLRATLIVASTARPQQLEASPPTESVVEKAARPPVEYGSPVSVDSLIRSEHVPGSPQPAVTQVKPRTLLLLRPLPANAVAPSPTRDVPDKSPYSEPSPAEDESPYRDDASSGPKRQSSKSPSRSLPLQVPFVSTQHPSLLLSGRGVYISRGGYGDKHRQQQVVKEAHARGLDGDGYAARKMSPPPPPPPPPGSPPPPRQQIQQQQQQIRSEGPLESFVDEEQQFAGTERQMDVSSYGGRSSVSPTPRTLYKSSQRLPPNLPPPRPPRVSQFQTPAVVGEPDSTKRVRARSASPILPARFSTQSDTASEPEDAPAFTSSTLTIPPPLDWKSAGTGPGKAGNTPDARQEFAVALASLRRLAAAVPSPLTGFENPVKEEKEEVRRERGVVRGSGGGGENEVPRESSGGRGSRDVEEEKPRRVRADEVSVSSRARRRGSGPVNFLHGFALKGERPVTAGSARSRADPKQEPPTKPAGNASSALTGGANPPVEDSPQIYARTVAALLASSPSLLPRSLSTGRSPLPPAFFANSQRATAALSAADLEEAVAMANAAVFKRQMASSAVNPMTRTGNPVPFGKPPARLPGKKAQRSRSVEPFRAAGERFPSPPPHPPSLPPTTPLQPKWGRTRPDNGGKSRDPDSDAKAREASSAEEERAVKAAADLLLASSSPSDVLLKRAAAHGARVVSRVGVYTGGSTTAGPLFRHAAARVGFGSSQRSSWRARAASSMK